MVGIGLSRFAYTPIVPALVAEGWFSQAEAGYLGAANLVGYLLGAIAAAWAGRRFGLRATVFSSLALASLAFLACAYPIAFLWYFAWRVISGIAGGMIMVLAVSMVTSQAAPGKRGLAGGIVFSGVGIGILASSFIVPLLLSSGLHATWVALATICTAAAIASVAAWPKEYQPRTPVDRTSTPEIRQNILCHRGLALVFAMTAVGLVPHMVFYSDFIARGLSQGIAAGSLYWALFGAGASIGPILAGKVADLLGFRVALRLAIATEAVGTGLLVISSGPASLTFSALVVGGLVTGTVPIVVGRVHELCGSDAFRQPVSWAQATMAFAMAQAAAGYFYSYLFANTGSHTLLFGIAGVVLLFALGVDIAIASLSADGCSGARARWRI